MLAALKCFFFLLFFLKTFQQDNDLHTAKAKADFGTSQALSLIEYILSDTEMRVNRNTPSDVNRAWESATEDGRNCLNLDVQSW